MISIRRNPHKSDYPDEFITHDGEIVARSPRPDETGEERLTREFYSFKMDLIETINADPAAHAAPVLAVVCVYLKFANKKTRAAYAATGTLQALTGHSRTTCRKARKLAVCLGYLSLKERGKGKDEADLFILANPREEIVQDHVLVMIEKIAEDRKREKERERLIKEMKTKRGGTDNIPLEMARGDNIRSPWGTDNIPNTLDGTLVSSPLEEAMVLSQPRTEGQCTLEKPYSAIDRDSQVPFEIPETDEAIEALLGELLNDQNVSSVFIDFCRTRLRQGSLTPKHINDILKAAVAA